MTKDKELKEEELKEVRGGDGNGVGEKCHNYLKSTGNCSLLISERPKDGSCNGCPVCR